MASSGVIIKFSAEDNLTPELKKQLEALQKLQKEYDTLDLKIKDLKADKKGILAGTVISDIDSVKKLQIEIAKLKEAYTTASKGDKTATKNALKAKQIELEAKLTKEINRQTITLKRYKEQLDYAGRSLEKDYVKREKLTNSIKREDRATQKATISHEKENAVRRSSINTIVRHLRQIETIVLAYYTLSRAIDATMTKGIMLNKTIEDGQVGIAALISANTDGGNSMERFSAAMAISADTMIDLKKASVDTAATFPQLTEVFQQAIGGALGAGQAMGKSVDEIIQNTIKLSQRMTNIAGSIGMPMEQVSQEIRAIMEGTITKDARIAKMLGITTKDINDAKKNVDGLVNFLEEKLSAFDVLASQQTLSRVTARFTDALDSIRMEATKPIFDDLKYEIADVTTLLRSKTDEWIEDIHSFYFSARANFGGLSDTFSILTDDIDILNGWFNEIANILGGKLGNGLNIFKTGLLGIDVILESIKAVGKDFNYIISISMQKIKEYIIDVKIMFNKLIEFTSLVGNRISFGSKSERTTITKHYDEIIKNLEKAKKELENTYKAPPSFLDNGNDFINNLNNNIKELQTNTEELAQGLREAFNLQDKKFKNTKELSDFVTPLVEKYKQYPEVIKDISHSVEKLLFTMNGGVILTTKQIAKAIEDIKKKEKDAYNNAVRLSKILSPNAKTLQSLKSVTYEDTIVHTDYSQSFQDSGYGVEAYDKANSTYSSLMSSTNIASQKNEIEKAYDTYIEYLNKRTIADYKNTQEQRKEHLRLHGTIKDGIDYQIEQYRQGIPTAYEQGINIMKDLTSTLQNSWSSFFDYTSKGFMDFGNLAINVLNDVYKQIVQMTVVSPLVNSIMGGVSGFMNPTSVVPANYSTHMGGYANGGVFEKFANGGTFTNKIIDTPTLFAYGDSFGSSLGVMGEAGAEAVMPLQRHNGVLGVKSTPSNVVINVKNESGIPMDFEKISQKQTDDGQVIDIVMKHLNYDQDFRTAVRGA